MSVVIEQLEQDRAMASKRARRMKEELKQAQAERDVAIKAAVELKSKLTAVKETSRKEITALQTKVAKVCKLECVWVYMILDECTLIFIHVHVHVHVHVCNKKRKPCIIIDKPTILYKSELVITFL